MYCKFEMLSLTVMYRAFLLNQHLMLTIFIQCNAGSSLKCMGYYSFPLCISICNIYYACICNFLRYTETDEKY